MKNLNIKDLVYVVYLDDIHLLYDRPMFEGNAHIISGKNMVMLTNEYLMNKEIVKYSIT